MTSGLSSGEAAARLRQDGHNDLPSARPRTAAAIAVDVLREPMLLLLVATGAIYLVLGDLREALAMIGAILVVVGITFVQERKTERTLHALRDLSSPRALVIRDGSAEADTWPRCRPWRRAAPQGRRPRTGRRRCNRERRADGR